MGLPRLSNVAKNYVVKKKVYNAKIKLIQDKIPDITNLTTNASFSAEINEVKGETLNITNSATNIALTAVENKIPDLINLVKKKNDYNTKTDEIENKLANDYDHDKYITT